MINWQLIWSIFTLNTVAATHPPPLVMWQAAGHVFLNNLANSLWEPESEKKKNHLPSKFGRFVLSLLIAASDHIGADQKEGGHCYCTYLVVANLSPSS